MRDTTFTEYRKRRTGVSWPVLLTALLLTLLQFPAQAVVEEELLDPDQAFVPTITAADADMVVAEWKIAPGYYLYRERFHFTSNTPGVRLGEPRFPPGKVKEDEYFGRMETYHDKVSVKIPLKREAGAPENLELKAVYQGCADAGICYPPQTKLLTASLSSAETPPTSTPAPKTDLLSALTKSANKSEESPGEQELLDPELAFIPSLTVPDANTLKATWEIADGYYLYRERLKIDIADAEGVSIASIDFPPGKIKADPDFGDQEVYYHEITATAHLNRSQPANREITVKLGYQGCAEAGVCYPPRTQSIPVTLPVLAAAQADETAPPPPAAAEKSEAPPESEETAETPSAAPQAEQDRISSMLREKGYFAMPAFFGFGLLLAFTPCIFPMIPILSSIIVGQGEDITKAKSFTLSLIYVLAMAITYTVAGVLAAMLAQNIQAMFQNPWVLGSFAILFVLLALSMFGFYDLQLPASWQSKLTEVSNNQSGGTHLGVGIMGLLSALIVGPCVAPPLIGILAMIAATGDIVLGGVALFTMSMGMGAPLLIIGAAGGHLLPRAGHWMDGVKAVFGVMLLGMAIWMISRVLSPTISMFLWSVLLIVTAIYMGALQPAKQEASTWQPMVRGLGVILLVYGVLLLVGVAAGGKDPLQPLHEIGFAATSPGTAGPGPKKPEFQNVETLSALQTALAQTEKPVMVDFTAEWCVSCKELEKFTFSDPGVQTEMANALLLRADVSENNEADKTLLQHFNLFGPPAILFFGPDGKERPAYRVVGFVPAEEFKAHLKKALRR